MTFDWPRTVITAVGSLIIAAGAASLLARNWLWGDAGYSVEARQPIMFLGVTWLVLGTAAVYVSIRGTASQLRLMAALAAAIVGATPLVSALNIAGWDRFYTSTGWPLPYVTTVFAIAIGLPTLLAYLALRSDGE